MRKAEIAEKLKIIYKSPEWYELRKSGIGGSDAATAIGINKYKTNSELWEEKCGISENTFTGNELTQLGTDSEEHITALFALEHPNFQYIDTKDVVYKKGFMFASLDGMITDKATNQNGILEIKTKLIQNSKAWQEWDNRIPDNYYIQLLHYGYVCDADFAVLKCRFRSTDVDGVLLIQEREYRIDYHDEQTKVDMDFVVSEETKFWECVKNKVIPATILPNL